MARLTWRGRVCSTETVIILLIVMSLAAKYRKSKEKRWCLRFKTVHPDSDDFDGVVTHVKQGFVVLRE